MPDTTSPEIEGISEQTKKEVLEELLKVQSVQEQVKLFGRVMDDYGLDFLASLAPTL
jgi:hypothetical protein